MCALCRRRHKAHLIRNTFRYASKADWAQLAKDLRPVYSAPTEQAARSALDEVEATWGERYPAIVRLWQNAWPEFVPFLSYSPEIRKVIYSTNAIESLHARFRRARGHFPNEQAALKCLYLTIRSLDPPAEAEHAGSPAGRRRSTRSPSRSKAEFRLTTKTMSNGIYTVDLTDPLSA